MRHYDLIHGLDFNSRHNAWESISKYGTKWNQKRKVEVIIVDNRRWNKIRENQIKFIDVAKQWMHECVMENVQKIKIKLENIWIDLIRSIDAPYRIIPVQSFSSRKASSSTCSFGESG